MRIDKDRIRCIRVGAMFLETQKGNEGKRT